MKTRLLGIALAAGLPLMLAAQTAPANPSAGTTTAKTAKAKKHHKKNKKSVKKNA